MDGIRSYRDDEGVRTYDVFEPGTPPDELGTSELDLEGAHAAVNAMKNKRRWEGIDADVLNFAFVYVMTEMLPDDLVDEIGRFAAVVAGELSLHIENHAKRLEDFSDQRSGPSA